MPACPRKLIYFPDEIGIYHCYSRCVQRAYLCGRDLVTGQSFEHRKAWIELRTALLAQLFAIDVLDMALLDNHMHHVLRNRPDIRDAWKDEDVARKWLTLRELNLPHICEVTIKSTELDALLRDGPRLAEYRRRLGSLSWYQKKLKESIAIWANTESGTSGHFWGSRFRSTLLADEAAVLACSIYVDLNPIRAGISETPETSRHTSAFLRIQSLMEANGTPLKARHGLPGPLESESQPAAEGTSIIMPGRAVSTEPPAEVSAEPSASNPLPPADDTATNVASEAESDKPESAAAEPSTVRRESRRPKRSKKYLEHPGGESEPDGGDAALCFDIPIRLGDFPRADGWLAPVPLEGEAANSTAPQHRASNRGFLPISAEQYLALLDWSGRIIKLDKVGQIPADLAPIFERLKINAPQWAETIREFHHWFPRVIGAPEMVEQAAQQAGCKWFKGITRCRSAFT